MYEVVTLVGFPRKSRRAVDIIRVLKTHAALKYTHGSRGLKLYVNPTLFGRFVILLITRVIGSHGSHGSSPATKRASPYPWRNRLNSRVFK